MSRADVDTIVVGAGVIGLSIAFELLRRGRSVLLVEKSRPGAGSTDAAGGMLAPVCEAEEQPPGLTELCLDSAARYPGFVADLESVAGRRTGYREDGTLSLAFTRDEYAEVSRLAETLASMQLPFERVDAARIGELESHLSSRVVGGLHILGDRQIDPRALVQVLQRAVQKLGGRFLCPEAVTEVLRDGRRATGVRSEDPEGRERVTSAENIVLSAGAWTTEAIAGGEPGLTVRPVKGQLVRLQGAPLIRHVVRTPEVYMIPREGGELLIGATVEEVGFDTTPRAGAVLDLLRHAWEALPGTYDLAYVGVDVGLRPATDDHLPLIGPTSTAGLFLATGHYRNGILLAPATACGVADWIEGANVDERVAAFDPRRHVLPETLR
jgi:glycine oxidase